MRNFIIWCTFFIPTLLFAQTGSSSDKQLFVGYIAAGMTASQISGDRMAGYRKVGGNAGVGAFIMYKEFLSNSIEIAYHMKGSQTAFKDNTDGFNFNKFSFDYVQIPFLVNYHEGDIAIFSAGFTFGRLIRSKLYNTTINLEGDLKPWDFAVTVGGTFLIKEVIGLNFTANFSMINIAKNAQAGSLARRGGWYHNSLAFRVVYLFKKKD